MGQRGTDTSCLSITVGACLLQLLMGWYDESCSEAWRKLPMKRGCPIYG